MELWPEDETGEQGLIEAYQATDGIGIWKKDHIGERVRAEPAKRAIGGKGIPVKDKKEKKVERSRTICFQG